MASQTKVQQITSDEEYKSATSSIPSTTLTVLYFHAPWAEPCKHMSTVLDTLASTYPANDPPKISFLSINAEDLPDISEEHDVTAVPYIVLRKDNQTVDTISGSDAQKVRAAVEKHVGTGSNGHAQLPPAQQVTHPTQQPIATPATDPAQPKTEEGAAGSNATGSAKNLSAYAPDSSDPATAPDYSGNTKPSLNTNTPNTNNFDEKAQSTQGGQSSSEDLQSRLSSLTNAAPAMLFMKGTPSAPQCGFSRQLVSLLRENNVRYGFFNILADDEVRQGLKEYSDWPTFPQLYLKGELVGGLDIVKEELEANPEYFEEFAVKKGTGGMGRAEA